MDAPGMDAQVTEWMGPDDERRRVAALESLGILDHATSEYFDAITRLALEVFGVSGSYISLIASERQWVKSSVGFCPPDSREESFCNHTIQRADVLVVEDATLDQRFVNNPVVTGPAHIRFYAGAPLLTPDGYAIGALCLTDTMPRQLSALQRGKLRSMAGLVMSHILLRRAVGHVDAVSGMPNMHQLEEDLSTQGRSAEGEDRVLVYIDMPDAARALRIASVLGVAVYDELIRGVALRLKGLFEPRARVYHVTDARFAILSQDARTADFIAFVHGLDASLAAPVCNLNVPINLLSFGGIVEFCLCTQSAKDAPRKAASAVNRALMGQQRWSAYNAEHDVSHQRAFRLLNDVRAAIEDNVFELVYQPKHNLSTGACLSAEALLRWTHPELGFVSPAEFIPLIEKTSLIGPLSNWVFRTALRQVAQWHAAGHAIKIAINLSAYNFEEPDIVERLAAACAEFGVAPRYVEIECTEGIWMEGPRILETLHRIRDLGMSLALDDFGTGYSNFSYLQKVPATVVKVDQSLIRNVHNNPRDQRIVRSLIALARELDYEVVAEGVETEHTLELIRGWGCHIAQGYHYARPLAPAAFLDHVRQYQRSMAA
ncbi:EAL domain-containing protein [Rugamonas sp.]|uniref:sensor domain-containing phosphodiesterase n=1 Tax=Rugamonas sp. TaxID=1926287 RepID=UPI0025E6EC4F|nr:EAL domain-containing protein [Rugamonas sp.]